MQFLLASRLSPIVVTVAITLLHVDNYGDILNLSSALPRYSTHMASNLVRKQITDKNGVISSRWVRSDQLAATGSKMPPPPSAASPRDEAARIGAEIRKSLNMMEQCGHPVDWSHEDMMHFRILVETADVDSVRVLQRHISQNMFSSPEKVGQITRELQRRGHDHPYELMTDEALEARGKIMRAIEDYGIAKMGVPYLSEQHQALDVWCMAFTDIDDAPRIADIVRERGLMAPEDYRGLIKRMDEGSYALGRGTL